MKVIIEIRFKKRSTVSPETLFREMKRAAYQLGEELDCIVLDSKLTKEYETAEEYYKSKKEKE